MTIASAAYTPFIFKDAGAKDDSECDFLLILGHKLSENGEPDSLLNERISAAKDYMLRHPDTMAIACGGKTGGSELSEAEVIKNSLVELGIDCRRILTEDESKTTFENFENCIGIIRSESQKEIEDVSVCILTSDYHIHRASVFAKLTGLKNIKKYAAYSNEKRVFSFLKEYPAAIDALIKCVKYKIKEVKK